MTSELFARMYEGITGSRAMPARIAGLLDRDTPPHEPEFEVGWVEALMRFQPSMIWEGCHSSFSDGLLYYAARSSPLQREQLGVALFASFCVAHSYRYGGDWTLQATDFAHIHKLSTEWQRFVSNRDLLQFFHIVVTALAGALDDEES